MSGLATLAPGYLSMASLRRFGVDEYHRMIEIGVLGEDDNVELLEGYVVLKMPRNPPHDGTIDLVHDALAHAAPSGWLLRTQQAITLSDSEPEPDQVLARGNKRTYLTRHPWPADIGLVVEVSDSLAIDRTDKGRIYARAGLPIYWIVNLVDRQVEVHTAPSGPTAAPAYAQVQVFVPGDSVPLVLDAATVGTIQVAELLP